MKPKDLKEAELVAITARKQPSMKDVAISAAEARKQAREIPIESNMVYVFETITSVAREGGLKAIFTRSDEKLFEGIATDEASINKHLGNVRMILLGYNFTVNVANSNGEATLTVEW